VVELLGELREYLLQFGGHAGAGGFSIEEEKVEPFAEAFHAVCAERLREVEREPSVEADTEVQLAELSPAIVRELKRFEPLGIGNPGPQLLVRSLEVKAIKLLKDAHLKVSLSDGKSTISGMMWRTTEHPALQVGNRVDVVGKADLNTFFGRTELQMNLQAVEESL
jgi:single-stranded-DNA-specific exonuclease